MSKIRTFRLLIVFIPAITLIVLMIFLLTIMELLMAFLNWNTEELRQFIMALTQLLGRKIKDNK